MYAQNILTLPAQDTKCSASIVFLLIICLTACNSFNTIRSHSVCEVVENPDKFRETEQIIVKGTVSESISFLGLSGFVLKDLDKDCTIGVKTDKIIPAIGKEIIVKGSLQELFSFGTNKLLIIEEHSN